MNAKVEVLAHYRELEGSAKESAQLKHTIAALRDQLCECIGEITDILGSLKGEHQELRSLIQRAQGVHDDSLSMLEGMPQAQRRETLRDAMLSVCGFEQP